MILMTKTVIRMDKGSFSSYRSFRCLGVLTTGPKCGRIFIVEGIRFKQNSPFEPSSLRAGGSRRWLSSLKRRVPGRGGGGGGLVAFTGFLVQKVWGEG